jgi:coenzyme PQQ precursor peptide PqqA
MRGWGPSKCARWNFSVDLAIGDWAAYVAVSLKRRKKQMSWTTPLLVEICIGLEINGYLPAEF